MVYIGNKYYISMSLVKVTPNITNDNIIPKLNLAEKFSVLLAKAPFCIHEITPERKLVNVSQSGLKMLNVKKEEVEGIDYFDCIAKQDRPRIKKLFQKATEGKSIEFTFKSNNPNQEIYYVSNFIPLKQMPNGLWHLIGITQDITEYKRNNNQLISIINNIPISISYCNKEATLIAANKHIIKKNTIGSSLRTILGTAGFKKVEKYFNKALMGKKQSFYHYQAKLKAHIYSTYLPYYNKNNEVTGVISSCTDISALKNNQKILQKTINKLTGTNTELEHYNYSVSHDLREPIRTISICIELLEEKTLLKDNKDIIKQIKQNISFINNLISNLSNYSKINHQTKILENVPIKNILDEIIENYKLSINKKILVSLDIEVNIVKINKLHVRQVLQNLIGNAIKYNESNIIKLNIEVTTKKNNYLFTIADNGIGIEPQYYKKIFEISCKIPSKYNSTGSGFGLSICKKIIDMYGGKITVKKNLETNGSIFSFAFPITKNK